MKKFIDVSDYNLISDYQLLKNNMDFVMVKATEGATFVANTLNGKYENLKSNGIKCGYYHFLRVTSSAKDQANAFYNAVKYKENGILNVLDIEADEILGKAETLANDFINYYRELSGESLIVYSYTNFIEDNFTYDFCQNNIFWVAQYKSNIDPSNVPKISKCKEIAAWQYTNKETFGFVKGYVDCNYVYTNSFYRQENVIQNVVQFDQNIADLQNELNYQGFKDKNGNKLIVDGIAGELTLSACPIVSFGAIGNITLWIQKRLKITTDAIFGGQTENAVKDFQAKNNLYVDGKVGTNTWKKLLNI